MKVIHFNSACAWIPSLEQVQSHGSVYDPCNIAEMTSKRLGTEIPTSHHSSWRSLEQQSLSTGWFTCERFGGNHKSYRRHPSDSARGRFVNRKNLTLLEAFKWIQDYSTNELRGVTPDTLFCFMLSKNFCYCAKEEGLRVLMAVSFTFWLHAQSIIQDLWKAALEKVSLHDIQGK